MKIKRTDFLYAEFKKHTKSNRQTKQNKTKRDSYILNTNHGSLRGEEWGIAEKMKGNKRYTFPFRK